MAGILGKIALMDLRQRKKSHGDLLTPSSVRKHSKANGDRNMLNRKHKRKEGKPHYRPPTLGTEDIKQAHLSEYLLARYASKPYRNGHKIQPARMVAAYRGERIRGEIVRAEALDFLRSLDSESASLVFLDPPFNLGKKYSPRDPENDTLPEGRYRVWMTDVLAESARVLKRGGAVYLYHLPMWAMRFGGALERFLDFRQWIAISMKNGFAPTNRLCAAHYALLCFTKGPALTFTRPRTKPARCRHCDGLVKDYGGYLPIIEKQGINLSDVWEDLSPVRHAKFKFRDANELPRLLFQRIMEMSAEPGGLYVDPFAGAGSGVIAALESGMRFAAGDLIDANCRLLRDRLKDFRRSRGRRD